MKKVLSLILCAAMLVCFCIPAYAETGSISLRFGKEQTPIPGVHFHAYKVAVLEDGIFVPVKEFAGLSVDFPQTDDVAVWQSLNVTLKAYAISNGVKPVADAVTDEAGEAVLENLDDGMYLILGDAGEFPEEHAWVFPQSMLVCLPYKDPEGVMTLTPQVELKIDRQTVMDSTVDVRALKIWKDEGFESVRPPEITVQLLGNGQLYDTVVLNEANNWRYEWDGLAPEIDWMVVETEVPEHFTVLMDRDGLVFIATNTREPEEPTQPPTQPSEVPTTPPTEPPPKLPQTGMVWWPVPVLLVLGAAALFAGVFLLLRRKKR